MVGISDCANTPREITSGLARARTCPCGDIVRKMCSATSVYAGSPSTLRGREILTGAAIGDPIEDTGTGTEVTSTVRTWMDRPTGAAHDAVSEGAVRLVGEDRTKTAAEAEVCKVVVVTTPPHHHHHQYGERIRGGGQKYRDGGRST